MAKTERMRETNPTLQIEKDPRTKTQEPIFDSEYRMKHNLKSH